MTILTGTSGNNWRDFATKLSSISSGNISVSDSSADHFAKHLQSSPQADAIIFAESPASLIANGTKDPGTLLDEWKTSATALLTLWRKHRKYVTILNWDESLADPAAFEKWLTSRFERKLGNAVRLPASAETSLARRVIANAILALDREASRLWNELQAASHPISNKAYTPDSPSPELALAELTHWQEQFAAERDALAHKLQENKEHAIQSHERLLEEIRNAHKESEDFFEQLEISRANCEAAKEELASVKGTHASDKQELERAQGELAALQSESQSIKENADRNYEMLLQEIQNAHKESEEFFEQWKSLEASAGAHHLVAERVLRGGEKHHPPHNHLDYVFERASLFERHWRRLPVRLVEHNGNAGLAVFHTSGNGTTPLYHWKPDGQESGLDFMLFVPSEKKAAARLVGLPASDLLLVRDAAAKILGHLSVHEGPEARRWLPVAQSLLQEIDEIPERLHYDSVTGFVNGEVKRPSIRFNAANLYFRGNCARSFVVDWAPAASGGSLHLETSEADTPLLLSSTSKIIVGSNSAEAEGSIRKLWPKLTAHDQAFFLLLAKALPDFVFHLCEQHPDQKANKERLTKQARKLYRRLRNLDRKLKLRNAIAKAIRR